MKLESKIPLGALAKDRTTGITGTVSALTVEMNGNIRAGLQPKSLDDNKLVEPLDFDQISIKLIKLWAEIEGNNDNTLPELQESRVELGQEVVDTISGYQGIVTGLTWFMNGCVTAGVTAKTLNKDGKVIIQYLLDHRLKVVTPAAAPAAPLARPTGGPITRSPQRR